jgi:hypothetical protein
MNDLLRALKEDAQNMEDISIEAGYRIKGYAVRGKTPSKVQWEIAVAVLHLLKAEIRRMEKEKS